MSFVKLSHIFSFLILFALVGCSFVSKRLPASTLGSSELDQLVISKLTLDLEKSFYIVGKKCESSKITCINWGEFGFESIEGEVLSYEAKFLITKNGTKLEDIYSFEYGNGRLRKFIRKELEVKDKLSSKALRKIRAKLPRHFLNITQVKKQRRPYSLLKYFLHAVNFTTFSAFSESMQEIVELVENKKVYQSVYLSRLVELMLLDKKYPKFMEEIGRDEVVAIGSALRIRFRNQITGVTSSIGTSQAESHLYYQKHIEFKTEIQSINMAKLVQRANEENLVIQVVSRDLAILLYDPKSQLHSRGYDDLLLNTRENLTDIEGEKLVALGIFTTIDSSGPTKVIDFDNTKLPIRNERITKFLDFGVSVWD